MEQPKTFLGGLGRRALLLFTLLFILHSFFILHAAPDAAAAQPPRQARSVHLFYAPLAADANAATATITVTETQTNSYFMTVGWDTGYCGLQDIGSHHIILFSVWDPGSMTDSGAKEAAVAEEHRVRVLYTAPGVGVTRFEGEGTGAKTWADIGWKTNEPVSVGIEVEPDGADRRAYYCHVKVGDGEWRHLATLSTLRAKEDGPRLAQLHSFVEDFLRNGWSATVARRAEFSGVATRSAASGAWVPVQAARFSADPTPTDNIDAGRTDAGAFFLQTGGGTRNAHTPLWGIIK